MVFFGLGFFFDSIRWQHQSLVFVYNTAWLYAGLHLIYDFMIKLMGYIMKSDTLIKVTCFAVLSEILYQISSRIYRRFKSSCNPNSLTYSLKELYSEPNDKTAQFHKVIFFPDPGIVCRRVLSGRICRDEHCVAVHDKTSLSVLLNVLNLSKQTLDVCVYMITCGLLGDALVECQRRGIILRVITEERNSGEEGEMSGSQIGKLRAAGI